MYQINEQRNIMGPYGTVIMSYANLCVKQTHVWINPLESIIDTYYYRKGETKASTGKITAVVTFAPFPLKATCKGMNFLAPGDNSSLSASVLKGIIKAG